MSLIIYGIAKANWFFYVLAPNDGFSAYANVYWDGISSYIIGGILKAKGLAACF